MDIRAYAKERILVLDGAMGTMLQQTHLKPGDAPDHLNIIAPKAVKAVHTAYLEAGANVILTNTFGSSRLKAGDKFAQMISSGAAIAKSAVKGYTAAVALNLGPLGELLEPAGMLSFDKAYELFKEQIELGVKAGVDAIYIETMTDLAEARCAVLAAKETCDLPIFCTMSFEQNMRTFMGTEISTMALTLSGLGVDFLGINCSAGPKEIYKMAQELMKWTDIPTIIKPNAGMPVLDNGVTTFEATPDSFAKEMQAVIDLGVSAVGGCCGTDPEYIVKLSAFTANKSAPRRCIDLPSAVCSYSKTLILDRVRIIGECINPTGKKPLEKAIIKNDLDYITDLALEQVQAGAEILDINIGVPGIDQAAAMKRVIKELQGIISVPLQIDSINADAIAAGLRAYNGKGIVNSVSGEQKALHTILPIAKKYGAAIVGLTMDETGIPRTAAKRLVIAEKIIETALEYGIPRRDIIIDCLTLTASAQQEIAYETLDALRLIKERLNVKTILGISNISFGLPERQTLNRVFLSLALGCGLDLAIINPTDKNMIDTVYCYHQLKNVDADSSAYLKRFSD